MKRHIGIVATVVALVAFGLTACGGDDDGGQRIPNDKDVSTGGADALPGGDATTGADGACAPSCVGKACGDDGCGGTCGACTQGLVCDATGHCVLEQGCVPDCAGKQCGPDGCGGACGSCYNGQGAVDPGLCRADGTCIPAGCAPQCAGKACGDDGCGGVCGVCAAGQTCQAGACTGGTAMGCSATNFQALASSTKIENQGSANEVFIHQEMTSETTPADMLSIEDYLFAPYNGPTAPGTYDLAGQNYADCGLCVLARTACTGSGCQKTFFMKSGTLTIQAYGGPGGAFKATLDATLEEVTIDPTTFQSTPVAGGQTWCFDDYAIDTTIVDQTPSDDCVTAGTGIMLGQNVGDFTLTNCLGETFSVHSLCKKTKLVWFTAVAGWCPACKEWLPKVNQAVADIRAQGGRVEHLAILGEDATGAPASQAFCVKFAQDHGVDPAWMFLDYQYETFFGHVWPYPGADGSFGVPWDAFLDGDNFRYEWHSSLTSPDINDALNSVLSN